eukprot:6463810-Amphidinium_carterae.1
MDAANSQRHSRAQVVETTAPVETDLTFSYAAAATPAYIFQQSVRLHANFYEFGFISTTTAAKDLVNHIVTESTEL